MEKTLIQAATEAPSWFCVLKENSFWTFIKEFASPAMALLSFGFAVYVHTKTRSLISHFERPILGLDKSQVQPVTGDFKNGAKMNNKWHMVFKNKGKHPAIDVKMTLTCVNSLQGKPLSSTFESPNRIDPDDYYTQSGDMLSVEPVTHAKPALIKLEIEYKDLFQPKKEYKEEHWYKFSGRNTIDHATMAEKDEIEKILNSSEKDGVK